MAFERLGDKLQSLLKKIKGQSRLTNDNMEEMLKEIKISLLEADVNLKVVNNFIDQVREKSLGANVLNVLSPGQMILKIVKEELINLLGEEQKDLNINGFSVIMMVGLQGSGKTTSSVKLANYMKKKFNKIPLLVALDVYRPAAIKQLLDLAKNNNLDAYYEEEKDLIKIATRAIEYARSKNYNLVIFDTAGRLQIDDKLMNELINLNNEIKINEKIYVVDAMSGQDIVNVVSSFNERIGLTCALVSKLDSDARGGSLLSIKHLTGIPIKFAGVGEKIDDFETFYPSRMAERILGMGDVLTLIEKAEEKIDEKEAKKTINKMMSGNFSLEDMLIQMQQVNKIGSLQGIAKFIPGMPKISQEEMDKAEAQMRKTKAIIYSMTKEERNNPSILKANRKIRIANGAGVGVNEVNKVINQYEKTKEMMKQMKSMFKGGKMTFGGF